MRTLWRAVRWGIAGVVVAASLAGFLTTIRHTPGPFVVRVPYEVWYGNWRAVVVVAGVFILFLVGFIWPRRPAEWRNAVRLRRGALAALVAAAGGIAAVVWGWRPHTAGGDGYQAVARWTIPGGEGRFVVIPGDPGTNDLHAVAERIREDFARYANGVAMVFDEVQAARDVRHGSRNLGEERFRAALRHQRAMYVKSAARAEESFVVYSDYPLVRETFRYGTRRQATAPRAAP